MSATLDHPGRPLTLLAGNSRAIFAAFFVSIAFFSQAQAQPQAQAQAPLSYTVTDLGTLGGGTSSASGTAGQQAQNTAGMIVGTSAASDGSDHAFLYTKAQMFDLNNLCDLSTSDFKVLTAAKTINDCCLIVGEGITVNGDKHAFLLTPTPVDGGSWCYVCCQWIWKQQDGGWWFETGCHCYKWHGGAGRHPPCPTPPPLPPPPASAQLPPTYQPPPPPTAPQCRCCIDGKVVLTTPADCLERE